MTLLHIAEKCDGASGVATFVRELDVSLRGLGVDSRACSHVEKAGHIDVLHIHGLWLPFFHRAAKWAKSKGVPVVWSTHGMTAPWSMHHKRWKKLMAWWLYQRRDLREAAAIHCTTELELRWNKKLGFDNCFIAPLGTRENKCHSPNYTINHTLLFVGRIYPVKGLVNLIKAWKIAISGQQLGVGGERWKLRIVGPDEAGHLAFLRSLVSQLSLDSSVEFPGPKFGAELSDEYEACDCLVLPSFTENFGATIVDAMAHGKPCIASTFTPWRELQDRGCGWWTSNEPTKLAAAILEMMLLGDATRREMGARGCKLVEEKYTWDAVARIMIHEYQKVISSCQ